MRNIKILIVEDEEALAEILEYNLRREGYDVYVANDGLDGLEKAQAIKPDLVILDLMYHP